MPIYEFYCEDCHMVFSFFSQRVNTDKFPDCPKSGRIHLEKQVSVFSVARKQSEPELDLFEGIDEGRIEKAMTSIAAELEGLDKRNPQQAVVMVRQIMDQAGIELGDNIKEAMGRLESGDNLEEIETSLADSFDDEAKLFSNKPSGMLKVIRRKLFPPTIDPKLYDL